MNSRYRQVRPSEACPAARPSLRAGHQHLHRFSVAQACSQDGLRPHRRIAPLTQAEPKAQASMVYRYCPQGQTSEACLQVRPCISPRSLLSDSRSSTTAARNCVVDQQHHDRADNRDNHAPNVQTRDASRAKKAEQKSTHESTDDAKRNIEPKTSTLLVDDLAPYEASNQTKYDPANNSHARASRSMEPFAHGPQLLKTGPFSMIVQLKLQVFLRRKTSQQQ